MEAEKIRKLTIPFLVVVTIMLWASAFVGIRYGMTSYHPGSFALLRYLVASLCMILIWHKNPGPSRVSKQDLLPLVLAGVLGIGLYNVMLNYGEISVSAAEASFVVGQTPVINAILAVLFLGEVAQNRLWVGLAISVFGVALIAYSNKHDFGLHYGLLFVLAATACGSLYTILQKPLLARIHSIRFACYAIWACCAALSVYLPQLIKDIQVAPISATLSAVYLGIFPGAIAYALWSYILSKLSATKTSSALYLSPIFTTLLGWVLLGEMPKMLSLMGGLIALVGAFVINQRPRATPANTRN